MLLAADRDAESPKPDLFGPMSLGSGLLLGQAVERPEPPDQFATIDSDNAALRKEPGQYFHGDMIVRLIVFRDEDDRVGNVEIGVAGRENQVLPDHARWHGQCDYFERLAVDLH